MRVDRTTLLAARKRGWSIRRISLAAGISPAGVAMRLRRYGDTTVVKKRNPNSKKTFSKCATCGAEKWLTSKTGASRRVYYETYYCSHRCAGLGKRKIDDRTIVEAIELRMAGETWAFIAKQIGVSPAAIQTRIWMRLFDQDALTRSLVYEIWSPKQAKWREREPKWAWLEKVTGKRPQ